MRTVPAPATRTERHHRLKSDLACGVHRGERLVRRQIEVTAGGRIWYMLNTEHRTVWIDSSQPMANAVAEWSTRSTRLSPPGI